MPLVPGDAANAVTPLGKSIEVSTPERTTMTWRDAHGVWCQPEEYDEMLNGMTQRRVFPPDLSVPGTDMSQKRTTWRDGSVQSTTSLHGRTDTDDGPAPLLASVTYDCTPDQRADSQNKEVKLQFMNPDGSREIGIICQPGTAMRSDVQVLTRPGEGALRFKGEVAQDESRLLQVIGDDPRAEAFEVQRLPVTHDTNPGAYWVKAHDLVVIIDQDGTFWMQPAGSEMSQSPVRVDGLGRNEAPPEQPNALQNNLRASEVNSRAQRSAGRSS